MCNYYVFDNEEKEFLSVSFAEFDIAEYFIGTELGNNCDRYDIYEKIT